MAKNGASSKFYFASKKPLFIIAEQSSWSGAYDAIEINSGDCDVRVTLSRENLKKLYYLIRERLKGERCHFTTDNEFIRHLQNGEIQETPAAEVLRDI